MKIDVTEKSPFTGKKSVVVEQTNGIETRICMDTGFTTNSEYTVGSSKIKEFEASTAELIRALRYEDTALKQYWYPTTVMFSTGIIYPIGSEENWEWSYAPIVDLSEEEKNDFPVPGKEGEYYETRLATELAENYPSYDFRAVCKRVGIAKEVQPEQ